MRSTLASPMKVAAPLVATLLMAAACGDDGGGTAVDAGPDAAPPRTDVSITLSDGDDPVIGIVVLLHDGDGTLLDVAATDLDGKHTFDEVASGSSVSLFAGGDNPAVLLTYFDVQPGDDLVIRGGSNTSDFSATVRFTLAVQGGASTYRVDSSCGPATVDAAVLESISINASCVVDGTVSLLATALDASDIPIAHAVIEDMPLSDGETKIANFPTWTAAPAAASFTASNVAPAATNSLVGLAVTRSANDYIAQSLSGAPGGSEIVRDLVPPPASFYDSYALILGFAEDINANLSSSAQLIRRHDGAVTDQSYDFDELRMPRISDVSVSWPASGARPKISIGTDAATNSLAPSLVLGGVSFGSHRWQFISPPGTAEAQLPELPNGLGFETSYPDPPDSTSMGIILFEGIDYDAYRNSALNTGLSMGQGFGSSNASISGASLSP